MVSCHLVRLGALGHVGRFTSFDAVRYPRGERVVLRTARGIETGEVLAWSAVAHRSRTDGAILRRMSVEDDLLEARLSKYRQRAFEACQARLAASGLPAVLMDVEQLFDGQSLYFYFLGEVTPELEQMVGELAEEYAAKIELRHFAQTLEAGCGPGCGTEQAPSGACSNCGSGCALMSACHPG